MLALETGPKPKCLPGRSMRTCHHVSACGGSSQRQVAVDSHLLILLVGPLVMETLLSGGGIQLESSDASHLAADLMCFKDANTLHSELVAMLDEPDDSIRHEKPYLPERDFSIWQFVRKFKRVPKEIREDAGNNKEENNLAQYIRKHKRKLHKETLTMLIKFTDEDTYSWCRDLRFVASSSSS